MIAGLLPPGVFAAENRDAVLHPDEAALIADAGDKRRREFAAGRACARAALKQMGLGDAAIGRARDGAPVWPDGVVGSITHTDGYTCAIVGPSARFAGMGVDAERIGGVGDNLLPRLFDDSEQARLLAMSAQDRRIAATLGFSAKESCFKAFGARFKDVHLDWDDGVFRTARGEGRYCVVGDLALTAIVIAR